jgi:hypothetical protein
MPVVRNAHRVWTGLWVCALLSCRVYDTSLVPAETADGGAVSEDAGMSCVATIEICNRRDDDCDGTVDEKDAAVLDCRQRVVHAMTSCQSGSCVWLRVCDKGYYNCDGRPDNGCESTCPCATECVDAGRAHNEDDAG